MYSFLFPAAEALCEGTRSFARTSTGRKSSVTGPQGREREVTTRGRAVMEGRGGAAQRYNSACNSVATDYTRWDLEEVEVVATLAKQWWWRWRRGGKFMYQL